MCIKVVAIIGPSNGTPIGAVSVVVFIDTVYVYGDGIVITVFSGWFTEYR
ncbi:hypothetical protein [Saccharolobus solfataricus]|nr:hypothetical protein [Saccharolobus solfataricus]